MGCWRMRLLLLLGLLLLYITTTSFAHDDHADDHDHHDDRGLLLVPPPKQKQRRHRRRRSGSPSLGCATHPDDDTRLELHLTVLDYHDRHDGGGGQKNDRLLQEDITISVYLHNFVPDEVTSALSKEEFDTYVSVLNQAFETDTPFTFVLAGAENIVDPSKYQCTPETETVWKGEHYVSGPSNLNIYICDLYRVDTSRAIRGYSSFPNVAGTNLDGVAVMTKDTFGLLRDSTYSTAHEVGHWLGLFHTFQNGCSADSQEISGFTITDGDDIDDTPAHSGPTWDQPQSTSCWIDQGLDTCDDTIVGIDSGLDPVQNWLNYIEPACWEQNGGQFTSGQISRMTALYAQYRSSVSSPTAAAPSASTPTASTPTASTPTASTPTASSPTASSPSSSSCKQRRESCRKSTECCQGYKCRKKRRNNNGGGDGTVRSCRRDCVRSGQPCRRDQDCCDETRTCQSVDSLLIRGRFCR